MVESRKQIQMFKKAMTKTGLAAVLDGFFGVSVIPLFGFLSGFGFRASNL